MLLLLAALFDAVLAWAILRMVAQARLYTGIAAPEGAVSASEPAGGWPAVTVVVPARDEADVIGPCVGGLLAQDYPGDRLRVVLVDDGSTDGTAEVARAAAGGDPRLRIVPGGALPRGWTGKSHACARGAEAAGDGWLCFMDADTRAEPALLRAAVARSLERGTGLLSLEPFQELGGPADRLVMPCGLYLLAATGDHAAVNDPGSDAAAANGQFMLFAPGAYAALGGHAAVRAEVCEDLALARLAKRRGIGFALLGAETLVRTRMYRDAAALWHGLSKNVGVLGGGAGRTVAIAAGGLLMALASLALPALAAARLAAGPWGAGDLAAAVLAFCGLFAVVGLHVAGTRHFRIPAAYGLAYPAGYALAFALAANAARLQRLGRVRWKDRTVEAPTGAAP
ncbi:glycosyltransferase [Lichenibacterium dinghuense]|uniref:glycosyltransferase n=1 Tax=Lichenibacterium dinghuense TaxID=2895977 RepID=UPI001F1AA398|nr:glycosyltransferase [Lichenibacterium sp. 6Y81]